MKKLCLVLCILLCIGLSCYSHQKKEYSHPIISGGPYRINIVEDSTTFFIGETLRLTIEVCNTSDSNIFLPTIGHMFSIEKKFEEGVLVLPNPPLPRFYDIIKDNSDSVIFIQSKDTISVKVEFSPFLERPLEEGDTLWYHLRYDIDIQNNNKITRYGGFSEDGIYIGIRDSLGTNPLHG